MSRDEQARPRGEKKLPSTQLSNKRQDVQGRMAGPLHGALSRRVGCIMPEASFPTWARVTWSLWEEHHGGGAKVGQTAASLRST